MTPQTRITILMENTATVPDMLTEHGWAVWITYGHKHTLFDTGASAQLLDNANTLGIDLSRADAIVLSHGHYDHTGGLPAVLDIAAHAVIYLHPAAVKPKYSQKPAGAKPIGMSIDAQRLLTHRHVIWTESPTMIFPGLSVTGRVPRTNPIEDVGGAFFQDATCQIPDTMNDDQSLFIETPQGMAIVLGCAHAGVMNVMQYISHLTGQKKFHAVIGGMHLLHAGPNRLDQTEAAFRAFNVRCLAPAHCTGSDVMKRFKKVFPGRCVRCGTGATFTM